MNKVSYVKTDEIFVEKYTLKKPQSEMHYHHSYELYYVIEGERKYFVGDKFFKVYKGDYIYIPKGMLHRTDGKGATRILVYFKEPFLEPYFKANVLTAILPEEPFVFRAEDVNADELQAFCTKLNREYKSYQADSQCGLSLATALFSLLVYVKTMPNTYDPDKFNNKRIEQLVKYVNENYVNITSIDDVVEYVGISKYYVCHLFFDCLGISFISYLNALKIKKACDLIREGKYSMTDISGMCGFNSPAYFCTVFKEHKGMSPSQYLKNIKSE